MWASKAAGRCRDCLSQENLCINPPQLLLHQYLHSLDPIEPEGNLVSLKAYLLTQVKRCSYRCCLCITGSALKQQKAAGCQLVWLCRPHMYSCTDDKVKRSLFLHLKHIG